MYYVYVTSGPSLLIESTDSTIPRSGTNAVEKGCFCPVNLNGMKTVVDSEH